MGERYPSDDKITKWAMAAGSGDKAAAAAFIRATQRDVWRFLGHLAGVAEADDLTQETYLRALTGLHRFAGQSSARTWLLSIARRVSVDHVRAISRRPQVATGDDWEILAEHAQRNVLPGIDDTVSLNLAIQALAPERRAAFVLTQLLGLDYAEAANVCDCPIGTIRSRVARARDDLVQALNDGRRRRVTNE